MGRGHGVSGESASWAPAAGLEALRARARMLADLRAFFAARSVLEVDTPQLSAAANSDPNLHSLCVTGQGDEPRWLHTSPEFPMKRLLAAGAGAIYQVCHVFRAGEAGRVHNPEFTLLEWYRPGFDHYRLMDEVAELLECLLGGDTPAKAPERFTYREVFRRHAGIDPFGVNAAGLRRALARHGVAPPGNELSRDECLDLLMGAVIGPQLGRERLCFVIDYPASQAALARVRRGPPDVAERFELYWRGVELANGYHELLDAREQARRFDRDNACRRRAGQPEMPVDRHLLAALQAGMPACAGVALGLDRLLMLKLGLNCLAAAMAFPCDRA